MQWNNEMQCYEIVQSSSAIQCNVIQCEAIASMQCSAMECNEMQ